MQEHIVTVRSCLRRMLSPLHTHLLAALSEVTHVETDPTQHAACRLCSEGCPQASVTINGKSERRSSVRSFALLMEISRF